MANNHTFYNDFFLFLCRMHERFSVLLELIDAFFTAYFFSLKNTEMSVRVIFRLNDIQ